MQVAIRRINNNAKTIERNRFLFLKSITILVSHFIKIYAPLKNNKSKVMGNKILKNNSKELVKPIAKNTIGTLSDPISIYL